VEEAFDNLCVKVAAVTRDRLSPLPCGHKLATDFDLLCRIDLRPFFHHPWVPFVLLVTLIVSCYFLRLVAVGQELYLLLCFCAIAYIASVLRARPGRAVLVSIVFTSVAVLSFLRSLSPDNSLALGAGPILAGAGILISMIAVFVQGIHHCLRLENIRKASTLVVGILLASGLLTLAAMAFAFALRLIPGLAESVAFTNADRFVAALIRYRLEMTAGAGALAIVWSAAVALEQTREEVYQKRSVEDLGTAVEERDHPFVQLMRSVIHAGTYALIFSENWLSEVVRVAGGIVREAWALIGPTIRLACLLLLSIWCTNLLHELSLDIADIWVNGASLGNLTHRGGTLVVLLQAMSAVVLVPLVALFKHPKNLTTNPVSVWVHIAYARNVFVSSIMLSILVYTFVICLAFYAAWWLIMPLTFAMGVDLRPIGPLWIVSSLLFAMIGLGRLLTK
jgi:hypothetical protein